MTVRFAINGLGRIGRALLRIARERDDLELVAANDLVPADLLAARLARDSVHGPFRGTVSAASRALVIDGRRLPLHAERDPARIPWTEAGAEIVVEATGEHLCRAQAAGHLGGSVERVVLTANAPQADVTLCLGVNDGDYDPVRHRVVSNASCTTNCAALVAAVLDHAFGLRAALLGSIHSYTGDQRIVDQAHPDPRRARAAGLNIIPTTTTAPAALGRVLPTLAGRFGGLAVRVPVPHGALLDLVADLTTEAAAEEVREAFREAARGPLAGRLAVCEEPLVSSDFIGEAASAVVDLPLVEVAGGRLCRVVAWYDNEWGYSSRLADLLRLLGTHDPT